MPFFVFLAANNFWVRKWNSLKTQAPIHLLFTFCLPSVYLYISTGACRKYLLYREEHLFIGHFPLISMFYVYICMQVGLDCKLFTASTATISYISLYFCLYSFLISWLPTFSPVISQVNTEKEMKRKSTPLPTWHVTVSQMLSNTSWRICYKTEPTESPPVITVKDCRRYK